MTDRWKVHFSAALRRRMAIAVLLGLVGGWQASTAQSLTTASPEIEAAARLTVKPFSLDDVRLLDGPFKDTMELNAQYLFRLSPDRLLHNFRKLAGLEPKAPLYGGWESMQIAGHSLGHYLTALSMYYAQTEEPRVRERIDYIVDELARAQEQWGNGYVGAIPGQKQLWKEIARGEVRGEPFALNGVWVPWYTLHKLYAGLIDAYAHAGNEKALRVVTGLADWASRTTDGLSAAQWQEMLDTEHGGMNEALANLYAITGQKRYLDLSRKFHHGDVLHPLARQRPALEGLHANTQIPKVIGAARQFELTGEDSLQTVAEFFWERVVNHHSYVIGGNTEGEHFGPPDALADRLGVTSAETCNTYNMLKLTRHLFAQSPAPRYADYYERGLYNHILASQEKKRGMMTYFVSLKPGHFKTYATPDSSFWCCVGSGMENHVRYGQGIYFQSADELYVNLFIPSEVAWDAKGITLQQETDFPENATTRLTVSTDTPVQARLNIRRPYWATETPTVRLNGTPVEASSTPSSYTTLDRTWSDGDMVEVTLPMSLHTESLPGDPDRVAVLYGPIVLAGLLGTQNVPAGGAYAKDHLTYTGIDPFIPESLRVDEQRRTLKTPSVPTLNIDPADVSTWLQPVEGEPLTFRTAGAGLHEPLTFRPFYDVHHRRYSVYWTTTNPTGEGGNGR